MNKLTPEEYPYYDIISYFLKYDFHNHIHPDSNDHIKYDLIKIFNTEEKVCTIYDFIYNNWCGCELSTEEEEVMKKGIRNILNE